MPRTATVGSPRYCLERVAGEWFRGEGDPRATLAALDDRQLTLLVEGIIEKRDTPMPRLRELLQKLAQAGPDQPEEPCT